MRMSKALVVCLLGLSVGAMRASAVQFDVGTAFLLPVIDKSNDIYQFAHTSDMNYTGVLHFGVNGYTTGLAVDPTREYLFATRATYTNGVDFSGGVSWNLYRFGADGSQAMWTFGQGSLAGATNVDRIAFANNGDLIISSNGTGLGIQEITQDGQYVRTIGAGSGPSLYAATWVPGTNSIYGVQGEAGGGSRHLMYKINAATGQVTNTYNVISNTSNIAYLPTGELAVHAFYNSGWGTAVYDQNGNLQRHTYPAGSGSQYESGWSSGFAYDPSTNRFVNADYAITSIDNKPDGTGQMPRVVSTGFSMVTPVGQYSLNYPAIAVAGEFAMVTTPPVYHQCGTDAGNWQGKALLGNKAGYTVGYNGCYLTATTMALDMLGHTTDPDKFNTLMAQQYAKAGITDDYMRFSLIPQQTTYGQTDGVEGPKVRFLAGNFGKTVSKQDVVDCIAKLIRDEGPVILGVPQPGNGLKDYNDAKDPLKHAVLAWKVDNNMVYIRNPLSQGTADESVLTLDDYINWVNNSGISAQYKLDSNYSFLGGQGYTYAERVTPGSKNVLTGEANCPVDLVITDAEGRRLGYDPTTATYYNDIPGSAYTRLSTGADAAHGDWSPVSFQIGEYLPGEEYKVQVFGLAAGDYSVEIDSNSIAGFNPMSVFTGTAGAGTVDALSFTAPVPEPGTLGLLGLAGLGLLSRRRR